MHTPADTVLTEYLNFARAVAVNYLRYHPLLNSQDWESVATDVLVEQMYKGPIARKQLSRTIENRLFALLRKAKRDRERMELIEMDEFGNPLNSLLDLRGASSLNPNACRRYSGDQPTHTDPRPHPRGFLEALQYVRASAPIQCGHGQETEYYRYRSAENRERVTVESRREGQRKQYKLKKMTQAA